ncbi:histidine-rich glycoprotein-like [Anoplophora glabripennis]|uniref:histidine-rich glycoprotein-like n=1 Tax=Anoplophora glabripennis TaxID=217634 RepID=UPI0008746AB6|nr:histidine-rich glycoprotein-like [Anoplophora glabripennis]
MGAWILASVFYACLLLTEAKHIVDATRNINIHPAPVRVTRQTEGLDVNKELPVEGDSGIHSAVSTQNNPETSATNYQPYNVKLYAVSAENDRDANSYNLYNGYNKGGSHEVDARRNEFASVEADVGRYNNQREYLDAAGYDHYKAATSFNLEDPRQLETVQREIEPYEVSEFQKSHKEEEQHAEVHYHQHKHVHKHNHKQEHTHKHQQEHKHEHGHKHDHHAQHQHKHDAQHKHVHQSGHKHGHRGEHYHNHHQEHKHNHHGSHKHDHKHQQDHKHDHHHGHKHSHHGEHKHSHRNEHKHNHHHGHKHENHHQHKHQHHADHKHNHGHKDEHKHQHHGSHNHKHSHHKL